MHLSETGRELTWPAIARWTGIDLRRHKGLSVEAGVSATAGDRKILWPRLEMAGMIINELQKIHKGL